LQCQVGVETEWSVNGTCALIDFGQAGFELMLVRVYYGLVVEEEEEEEWEEEPTKPALVFVDKDLTHGTTILIRLQQAHLDGFVLQQVDETFLGFFSKGLLCVCPNTVIS
jgi:hypothetical protein